MLKVLHLTSFSLVFTTGHW